MKQLPVALFVLAACNSGPRSTTIAATWQLFGNTLSVAAWGKDSAVINAAIARIRDSTQSVDSSVLRATLRREWAAERAEPRLQPEWRDVADSYALDQVAGEFAAAVDSALFDLGGLFLWIGPDTKRTVGISDPDNTLDALAHVELRAGALATVSGQHRSITVLAPGAFMASSWASALFGLGCDRALVLAPRLADRKINLVCADSTGVRWSPDLQNRVSLPAGRAP